VGVPHHITQRGNNSQQVFLDDEDRRRYQNILLEQFEPLRNFAVGLVLDDQSRASDRSARRGDSLARLIRRTHSQYAQQFNQQKRKRGRSLFAAVDIGGDWDDDGSASAGGGTLTVATQTAGAAAMQVLGPSFGRQIYFEFDTGGLGCN